MTNKEKILQMIRKLPDDVTYNRVLCHLDLMSAIEKSIEQIERGEIIEHDELVQQWREKGWLDEPESSGPKKRTKTSKKSAAASGSSARKGQQSRSQAGSSRR